MADHGGCQATVTEPYALRVIGDSMAPEFEHGQIVIVDPGYVPVDGAFVVVDYGGEVMFGQLAVRNGQRLLRFLNAEHADVALHPPYEFRGVIIQRVGRRRRDRKYYDYPAPESNKGVA